MSGFVIPSGGVEVHQDGLEVPFEINGDGSGLAGLNGVGGSAPFQVGVGADDAFACNVALLVMCFWIPTHKVDTSIKGFGAGVLDDEFDSGSAFDFGSDNRVLDVGVGFTKELIPSNGLAFGGIGNGVVVITNEFAG